MLASALPEATQPVADKFVPQQTGKRYKFERQNTISIRINTILLMIVEVPETRFLKETGFLIVAYLKRIDISVWVNGC
jgi:hypothetical protein